jgi:acetylornithine deacetylase
MTISIDKPYLLKTLTDLVGIESINPTLGPGGSGEANIAAYLAQAMEELGLRVTTHEPEAGRVSVVGLYPGSGGGRSLMLNGHIDTVGVAGMPDPFTAAVRQGKLYGRGAYDMKGSVAAGLTAVKALVEAGVSLNGDLLLAAVADEEYASLGTADLVKRYKPEGALQRHDPIVLRPVLSAFQSRVHQGNRRSRWGHGNCQKLLSQRLRVS